MSAEHVVVIGAGIVGLCAADSLVSQGFKVTVLEKDDAFGAGCSFGNGGIVVPSHFVPLAAPGMIATGLKMMLDKTSPFGVDNMFDLETAAWIAKFMKASSKAHVRESAPLLKDLNLASRDAYEEMLGDCKEQVGYARKGLLMLCRSKKVLEAEQHLADHANELGLHARALSASEISQVEPNVTMDVAGGVYFEDDAHLTPSAVMHWLRKRVTDAGVELRTGAEVCGFNVKEARVEAVLVDGGAIHADSFVLAAGSWSGQLACELGLKLPLLAGKGYGFVAPNPPQMPQVPMILVEGRIAVTPMLDGLRFVGTLELGHPNTAASPSRIEGMKKSIPEFYPAFKPETLSDLPVWCGLRPCSPDGLPYIGRPARFSNLVVATGHAMMGMSLGPISGRLVADLVVGKTPSFAMALLSPDRYA